MSTTLDQTTPVTTARARDISRVLVVAIPVADLAVSAAWYRDLLDLDYVREFGDENQVTGCALADFSARYMIALRRRDTTYGEADLRAEHPIIVEAADAAAAERVRARAAARGVASTSGVHADGTWIEFLDPDGIAIRVVYDASGPQSFLGVTWTKAGVACYDQPRLRLVPQRLTTSPPGGAQELVGETGQEGGEGVTVLR
jgi:catechol 2,3-dioxygenase-like lactoylglutathione lyase family enzyme